MHDKKHGLFVVGGGEGFEQILQGHVDSIMRSIGRYGFARGQNDKPNPKMAMTLVRGILRGAEERLRETTSTYVRSQLEQQIARYIALGWAHGAGYSEQSFMKKFDPLVKRVTDFFAPPAEHFVVDGEYTLLLILPPTWVPRRRALASLLGDDFQSEVDVSTLTFREPRKTPVDAPYVLVGINGGRELSGMSITQSDACVREREHSYFSLHELCQLFLMRPGFLPTPSGGLGEQSEAFALGEKCPNGLPRLVATKSGISLATSDEKNVHGGVGVGKPYFTKMII